MPQILIKPLYYFLGIKFTLNLFCRSSDIFLTGFRFTKFTFTKTLHKIFNKENLLLLLHQYPKLESYAASNT